MNFKFLCIQQLLSFRQSFSKPCERPLGNICTGFTLKGLNSKKPTSPASPRDYGGLRNFSKLFITIAIVNVCGVALMAVEPAVEFVDEHTFESSRSVIQAQQMKSAPVLKIAQNNLPSSGWSHSLKGNDVILAEDKTRVVMGSHLEVKANEILDEVVVVGGSAEISGTVKRLVVMGGEVHLTSTAVISEELNIIGGVLNRDPGAQVHGKQVKLGVPLSQESWKMIRQRIATSELGNFLTGVPFQLGFVILKIMMIFIFALIGQYVAPFYSGKVEQAIRLKPIQQLVWGFVSFFVFWPIMIFLCLSIVGIPLLPLQFSLAFLFVLLGYAYLAKVLGLLLFQKFSLFPKAPAWVVLLVGLLLIELISEVPYLGRILYWAIVVTGFGAASKRFYSQILSPHKIQPGSTSIGSV